jgi:hypothetical protein
MVPVRHLEQLLTELLQLHQVRHAAEPVDLEG